MDVKKHREIQRNIKFQRFRGRNLPDDFNRGVTNEMARNNPAEIAEHTDESQAHSVDRQEALRSCLDGITRQLLLAIEQHLTPAQAASIIKGLHSNEPVKYYHAFLALQNIIQEQPHLAEAVPVFEYLAALPEDLGFIAPLILKHSSPAYHDTYGARREGAKIFIYKPARADINKLKGDERRYIESALSGGKEDDQYLMISEFEERMLALGAGNLVSFEREYNRLSEVQLKNPEYRARPHQQIREAIRVTRAAIRMHGDRWERICPEQLRRVHMQMRDLEWMIDNPVFTSPAQQRSLTEVMDFTPEFRNLSELQDGGYYRGNLSWSTLMHKLWNDPTALQEQWEELTLFGESSYSIYKTFAKKLANPALAEDAFFNEQLSSLAPAVAEAHGEKVQGDPTEYVLAKIFLSADQPRAWQSDYRINEALSLIRQYEDPEKDPKKRNASTITTTIAELENILKRTLWRRLENFKASIEEVLADSELDKKIAQMAPGVYRDFFIYELARQQGAASPEQLRAAIEQMQVDLGDGALANRAQDLMNQYVKGNYQGGTVHDDDWRFEELEKRGFLDPADADQYRGKGTELRWEIEAQRIKLRKSRTNYSYWHKERKQAYLEAAEDYPPSRYLFVFSDAVVKDGSKEGLLEPTYKARLMAEYFNQEMTPLAAEVQRTGVLPARLVEIKQQVMAWAPEENMFRDFFLENIIHLELWAHLQQTSLVGKLSESGIVLAVHQIDLAAHLGEHDQGVLSEAYMVRYPVVRVEGLEKKSHLLTLEEKKALADFLALKKAPLTEVTTETYERAAIALEVDYLRVHYQELRQAQLSEVAEPTEADRLIAGEEAFNTILNYVIERFPRATFHRDTILFELMAGIATTKDQIQRLERLTYDYLMRHPAEEKQGEEAPVAMTEAVKNYIAMFPNREMRRNVLSWLFNGLITDDRFLEGSTFSVDEQEKIELFWSLSTEERKAVLYGALMGTSGLFDVPPHTSEGYDLIAGTFKGRYKQEQVDFIKFIREFYENNFADLFENPIIGDVFQIIFFEVFARYSTARRIELFLAIAERMKELRSTGQELNRGEALRIMLEQVGVVGVKAGQVLSEQGDLLPEEIRQELSSLRDHATPFNKRGVFTYVQTAGLFEATEGRAAISEIGELLGSASIKQVHRITMTDGEELALKVARPTIDRHYREDFEVLEHVLERLGREGYDVPPWVLNEIRRVVDIEMDFGTEARNAHEMQEGLSQRHATIQINGAEVAIATPQVKILVERGSQRIRNLQLMAEEFARGVTLQEIMVFQRINSLTEREGHDINELYKIEEKLKRLYGARAAEVQEKLLAVDVAALRSQLVVEVLLNQIGQDQVFHADLHSGNVILDLFPGEEKVSVIDAGSAGESEAPDEYLELVSNILLMKTAFGKTGVKRLAEILTKHVGGESTLQEWKNKIEEIHERPMRVAEVFTEILAEMHRQNPEINQNIRFLMKALAAAGGHLEALQQRIVGTLPGAMMESSISGRPIAEILAEKLPEARKLQPIIQHMPQIAVLLSLK